MRKSVNRCPPRLLKYACTWALLGLLHGCGSADPRQVEGALAKAMQAVAEKDARQLFRVIDERSRHAMSSIVKDRQRASLAIRSHYPEGEKSAALAALGDSAEAKDPADLFRLRCDASCLERFGSVLGPPASMVEEGRFVTVETTRGTQLKMYHGGDTWWGIVWRTEELFRERERAAAEREMVERNVALYAKRKQLE